MPLTKRAKPVVSKISGIPKTCRGFENHQHQIKFKFSNVIVLNYWHTNDLKTKFE